MESPFQNKPQHEEEPDLSKLPDSELVALVQVKSEPAFAELVTRYKPRIIKIVFSIVEDVQKAQDITQETFLKAFEALDKGKYVEEEHFDDWITKIAKNLAIDYLRAHDDRVNYGKFIPAEVIKEEDSEPDESFWLDKTFLLELLLSGRLNQVLTLEEQTILQLRAQGKKHREIAEKIGIKAGTARVLSHRAIQKIHKYYNSAEYKQISAGKVPKKEFPEQLPEETKQKITQMIDEGNLEEAVKELRLLPREHIVQMFRLFEDTKDRFGIMFEALQMYK